MTTAPTRFGSLFEYIRILWLECDRTVSGMLLKTSYYKNVLYISGKV